MAEVSGAYRQAEARFRRIGLIEQITNMLDWDAAVMMPEASAPARAEQFAALAVIRHEHLNDPALSDLVEAAAVAEAGGNPWRRANVLEMRRRIRHATAVPAELAGALARATQLCEIAWRAARADDNFPALLPTLSEVLGLTREAAAAKGEALGLSPYDALLDQFDAGARAAEIDGIFAALEAFLPGLIARVIEHQASRPAPLPLDGPFAIEVQKRLGADLMTALGFDFARGRLDVSAHPFCGGVPGDIRLTTRYRDEEFLSALMGVLHETGHALYEANLPEAWRLQPVGSARGTGLHESQSLFVEMQICRSRAFFAFLAPLLCDAFDRQGPAWSADNLFARATSVRRSLIRVEADEVTYPAHVLLRYRLERELIAEDLALADLPGAWVEGMRDLVGIVPGNDREGCLQDIHWPVGAFGYFPNYTLGAMMAAQFFDAAVSADPSIPAAIARGDFSGAIGWTRAHVHARASSAATPEILAEATGKPLDPAIFRRHLEARYLA